MSPALIVGIVLLVAILFYLIGLYNKAIRLRQQVKNGFAQIDVQLNRRYDLIPNLVETAKAFMQHERETLEAVIKARNQAHSALKGSQSGQNMAPLLAAEGSLGKSLGSFMALAENYPQLKSDATMTTLMEELSSTENKVAFARQHYNDSIMGFNVMIESFPANVFLKNFGFKTYRPFEVKRDEIRESVTVKF
jgi:LemA protein